MKKSVRGLLALSLTFIMVLLAAAPVSAGSVDWAGSDGYTYTATTNAGSTYLLAVPVSNATVITHEVGETEVITWPAGNSAKHETSYPSSVSGFRYYLDDALEQDGLSRVAISNVPSGNYYVLGADLPAKTYSFGMEATVCDVTCTIRQSRIQMNQTYAIEQPYATGVLEEAVISYTACKLIVI